MTKFIEKEDIFGEKIWELQIDNKIPCTEEEQKIYGVKFKIDPDEIKPFIVRQKFIDEGYYYRVYTGMLRYDYITKEFINLDNAKAFLISLLVDQKTTT